MRYASLRQGLVGAWCPSVSGPFGYRLPDLSGYGNHGTLTNMTPSSKWITSDGVQCLDFATASPRNYVLANSVALTPNLTLAGWVRPAGSGDSYQILMSQVNAYQILVYTNTPGTAPRFSIWVDGVLKEVTGTVAVSANTWSHLAGTFNGSTLKLFINGKLNNTLAASGVSSTTTNQLWLGAYRDNTTLNRLNGKLNDVRLYTRCLSDAEVALLASQHGIGLKPERLRNRYSAPITTNTRNRSSRFLGFPA